MLNVILFQYTYTIAIAGASGNLGRELVLQSLNRNHNVLAISKTEKNI